MSLLSKMKENRKNHLERQKQAQANRQALTNIYKEELVKQQRKETAKALRNKAKMDAKLKAKEYARTASMSPMELRVDKIQKTANKITGGIDDFTKELNALGGGTKKTSSGSRRRKNAKKKNKSADPFDDFGDLDF